jgi:hypothetical protein
VQLGPREKAREVSTALRSEVAAARSLPLPTVDEAVDVYDASSSEEVLVMTDAAIQVKSLRSLPPRARAGRTTKREKKAKKRVISTDLLLLEGRDGSFRYLWAGLETGSQASAR